MSINHGQLNVSDDNYLITEVFRGSFNTEAIVDYANKLKDIVIFYRGKAFVLLVDSSAFDGGTPNSFEELNRFNAWLSKQNIVAKAYIITSDIHRHILI